MLMFLEHIVYFGNIHIIYLTVNLYLNWLLEMNHVKDVNLFEYQY